MMNKTGKPDFIPGKIGICGLLLIIGMYAGCAGADGADPAVYSFADLPFAMPDLKVPQFPDRTFLITGYGAVGDGQTKNTAAFDKAIQACSKAGGGHVVVPAGLWLTGPIHLQSHINLHLERGAVVLFSPLFEDYPLIKNTFEGLESVRCTSPLSGRDLDTVAVTGDGIFDGSGQAWRPVKKSKLTEGQWKDLTASGGAVEPSGNIWWPSEEAMNGQKTVARLKREGADVAEYAAARQFLRPVLVSLVNCKNVLLDGPTFQNSTGWNIHPLLCENMMIRNLIVRNPWYSQNGDGLDLESCRNVLLQNCRFDVGDDAMCMKSGRDEYGRRRGRPTENVVIRDCTVYHGHGGFVVGSEMSGGVRNISVRNCDFLGTDVGVRFKSTRGRGGVVENIYIQDIYMTDIATDAIRFNLFYEIKSSGPEQSLTLPAEPVSEETPRFQNIHLENIVCSGAEKAMYLQGLPEMPVRGIELENAVLSADEGVTCIEGDQITMKNVKIIKKKGLALGFYNSRNITLSQVTSGSPEEVFMKLAGSKTAAVRLEGSTRSVPADKIVYGQGAGPSVVIRE